MDEDAIAAVVLVGVWVAVVAGLLGAIVATKRERRRAENERLIRVAQNHAREDDRLSNLERSVEAIAMELERVGEGQRFVTKLLAETRVLPATGSRSPRSPIPASRKHDSPPPTA